MNPTFDSIEFNLTNIYITENDEYIDVWKLKLNIKLNHENIDIYYYIDSSMETVYFFKSLLSVYIVLCHQPTIYEYVYINQDIPKTDPYRYMIDNIPLLLFIHHMLTNNFKYYYHLHSNTTEDLITLDTYYYENYICVLTPSTSSTAAQNDSNTYAYAHVYNTDMSTSTEHTDSIEWFEYMRVKSSIHPETLISIAIRNNDYINKDYRSHGKLKIVKDFDKLKLKLELTKKHSDICNIDYLTDSFPLLIINPKTYITYEPNESFVMEARAAIKQNQTYQL